MKQMKKIFVLMAILFVAIFASACGEANVVNVIFIVDGEIYHTLQIETEEDIILPEDPTKPNYKFDGWFEDEGVWNLPITEEYLKSIELSEDFSVYAKFTLSAFTITYHLDNGQNNAQNPEFYNPDNGNVTLLDAEKTG